MASLSSSISRADKRNWNDRADTVLHRHVTLGAFLVVVTGFCCRLWLAHSTFFNTDEAWHYSVANNDSLLSVYKASLSLAHPPLLVVILYFWKHLGTSDLMLRLPGVLAAAIFCWVYYKWLDRLFGESIALVGLIFVSLLPPMIALTSELRQYGFLLMFAVIAAYLLERAYAENSVRWMAGSFLSLYLAALSHYSGFLFAAALGIYGVARMLQKSSRAPLKVTWIVGQAVGVTLAWFLYRTHISKLGTVYPGEPLQRFGDFYLADWYFHAGHDHLFPFLVRGTFGIFRFAFGYTGIGQIAAVLFLAGIAVLFLDKAPGSSRSSSLPAGLLLATPFLLNWIAVVAGLYPYGRTRQCAYLAVFAFAGVSVALAKMIRNAVAPAVGLAFLIVISCHAFGTLQGRDMLPLAEQRHEHMDHMIQFIRTSVAPDDVILTDQATGYQLQYYLCDREPVRREILSRGFESFHCGRFHSVTTGPRAGALMAEAFSPRFQEMADASSLSPANTVWVVQGGWATGLGEALRSQSREFAHVEPHSFGRYLEVFRINGKTSP